MSLLSIVVNNMLLMYFLRKGELARRAYMPSSISVCRAYGSLSSFDFLLLRLSQTFKENLAATTTNLLLAFAAL